MLLLIDQYVYGRLYEDLNFLLLLNAQFVKEEN